MRNLWLDILIAFFIWQIGIYIYENTTPQYFLQEEIKAFNEDVENGNVLKDYHITKETEPNELSNTIAQVSDFSRQTIAIFVDLTMGIISGFD